MKRRILAALAGCLVVAALQVPREARGAAPYTLIGSFPVGAIPTGLALGSNGMLYVADEYNGVGLRLFSGSGVPMGTFDPGGAIETYGIGFLSDQSIVFTDYYGKRVLHYSPGGALLSQFPTGGTVAGRLAVDGSDNIYVVDDPGDLVRKFTSTGSLIGSLFVNHPAGVACAEGKVFVSETFAATSTSSHPTEPPWDRSRTGAPPSPSSSPRPAPDCSISATTGRAC